MVQLLLQFLLSYFDTLNGSTSLRILTSVLASWLHCCHYNKLADLKRCFWEYCISSNTNICDDYNHTFFNLFYFRMTLSGRRNLKAEMKNWFLGREKQTRMECKYQSTSTLELWSFVSKVLAVNWGASHKTT